MPRSFGAGVTATAFLFRASISSKVLASRGACGVSSASCLAHGGVMSERNGDVESSSGRAVTGWTGEVLLLSELKGVL